MKEIRLKDAKTPNGDAIVDDTNDAIRVNIVAGAGSGGTASTDDAAFTAAGGSGTPMMGFVTSDAVDSGDVGVVGMLANRQLKVTLYDSSGVEQAVGGGTQYTEDAAAAANPVGNALIMVRADTLGALTTTDGDNVAARGTDKGELYVKHVDAIPVTDNSGTLSVDDGAGSLTVDNAALSVTGGGVEASALRVTLANDSTGVLSVDDNGGSLTIDGTVTANLAAGTNNIGDVDVLSVVPGTGATNLGKAEDAAHTTGDTGVMILAVRDDSLAAVSGTDGDYEPLHTDDNGALWVQPAIHDIIHEAVSDTGGTSTAFTNFGAVASTKNYVTAITVFRTDSGTTTAYVDFRDGAAGSVIWRMPLPPNGGSTLSSTKPIFKTTANTALAYDVSAALTTVYISVSGFQAP